MEKIIRPIRSEPITIEIEKQGSKQSKHPSWIAGVIETIKAYDDAERKVHITKAKEGQTMIFEAGAEPPAEWVKEKSHNKTADESMKKLGYEKIAQTDIRVSYMKNIDGYVEIVYIDRVGETEIFKCVEGEMVWINKKEAKACLKKIKELGW